MAQLRWGARRSLDAIYADLADIIDLATDDPSTVRKLAHRITTRMREEIEPKLQRESAGSPLEQRVEALERLVNTIMNPAERQDAANKALERMDEEQSEILSQFL